MVVRRVGVAGLGPDYPRSPSAISKGGFGASKRLSRKGACLMGNTATARIATTEFGVGVPLLTLVLLLGCSSGKANVHICTDFVCHNEFVASITLLTNTTPSGAEAVTITTDGGSFTCSFAFPPDAGSSPAGQCTAGVTLVVQQASKCQVVTGDATTGQKCTPITGQYVELITVKGTPTSVRIQQTVEGTVTLDKTVAPSYEANEPNGPDCPPSCEQAGVQWSM